MASSSSEEQRPEQQLPTPSQQSPAAVGVKDCMHKTKLIQFFGRTTPIILQNDNGPCPLLAICNVLLLKNNLNLSPDTAEVSQEKLLSLVAERLIDSNTNINNKDEGYLENQQQNISDAIDLLPRLATGIDVNIKFRRINDFEFTPECAIFDLLDIPLYHGWIVDPQDYETANAIGSKSYNALMEELVALETRNIERECESSPEEDCVDFAAATTATLGVPSPCLSKARSFDDSPHSSSDDQKIRKGDLEEEAELLRALQISKGESPPALGDPLVTDVDDELRSDKSANFKEIMAVGSVDTSEKHVFENNIHKPDLSMSNDFNAANNESKDPMCFQSTPVQPVCSSLRINEQNIDIGVVEKSSVETLVSSESLVSSFPGRNNASLENKDADNLVGGEKIDHETADQKDGCNSIELSYVSAPNADLQSDSSSGRMQSVDASEAVASSADDSEPIYEGEECIFDSATKVFEDREPVYEGEVVLAKQADKSSLGMSPKDEITPQAGEVIRNFLKNNASQLTFSGLFLLQEGLKERELCVFFRNNHFSTMFKFEKELYLLATDQGYINQPDLVWEKLNEVNGDTLFMTGNFKEFKVENHVNDNWDEHNAMTSTADYLASIDNAANAGLDINSDLQLAIALQQQEFEQQSPRQNTQQQQQPSIGGNSRLVTGPQVPRSSARNPSVVPTRPEAKSKDKCTVM
ncbi:hypothetical protein UlMin_002351 [Ulmus minor]